jgi:PDZ domain
MMGVRVFRLFLLIMTLSCGPALAQIGPKIEDDKFHPLIKISGVDSTSSFDDYGAASTFIRSFAARDGSKISHQIYVSAYYRGSGWHFFETAYDDTAKPYEVTKIGSEVGTCSRYSCGHYETIGIDVDDAFLKSAAKNTKQIKVFGKSGVSFILVITPRQANLQLLAINSLNLPSQKYEVADRFLPYTKVRDFGAFVFWDTLYAGGYGARIQSIDKSSPFYVAGIRKGEALVRVNGVRIESLDELFRAYDEAEIGSEIIMTAPAGKTYKVRVK